MAKVLMTVELEYDADVVHGDDEEGKTWFFEDILSEEKGLLLLHSNEIGDTVGKIRVLSAAPSNAEVTGRASAACEGPRCPPC